MEIKFTAKADEDFLFWKNQNRDDILKKIRILLEDIVKRPFAGLGKPEPLKYKYWGSWSRRINNEHRLVYKIHENTIIVYSMKGHYK